MTNAELIERLCATDDAANRVSALETDNVRVDAELAAAFKARYLGQVAKDPAAATATAATLTWLAEQVSDTGVAAFAAWTEGLAAIQLKGEFERGAQCVDRAVELFRAVDRPVDAAGAQVSKIYALAMLGRLDEAIECGLAARDALLTHGDQAAAGRVEQNLGNIYWRRDQYAEAERLYRQARDRFLALGDTPQLAQIENCLGNVLGQQHRFRAAAEHFQAALAHAEQADLAATRAEVEGNIGSLALRQGRYDRALDYLERARRGYTALGARHRVGLIEQELADAYLDLNLAPEAAAMYTRLADEFAELGMRAYLAPTRLNQARALVALGQPDAAEPSLELARAAYADDSNAVGVALTDLVEAQLRFAAAQLELAQAAAARAEPPLRAAGNWRRALQARWLGGEARRRQGQLETADALLTSTLADARRHIVPEVEPVCLTSLGLLAGQRGETAVAERAYRQAIELTEDLRAPLPAESFRAAFFADKLAPYLELVRLTLNTRRDIAEAWSLVERSRSQALLATLGGATASVARARDDFERELLARLDDQREELNWQYHRLERAQAGPGAPNPDALEALQAAVIEHERAVIETTRQLQQRGDGGFSRSRPVALDALQSALGDHTALVEYYALDDELIAFVITDAGCRVARELGSLTEVGKLARQLRFQIDALRYGADRIGGRLEQLTLRTTHYCRQLYDRLLRPLEPWSAERRLAVVPHGALHYLPFQALHDGVDYVIEQREVVVAPSASVLAHCLAAPRRDIARAVLIGVADERNPRALDEIADLTPLLPGAVVLAGDAATPGAAREQAVGADIFHLACHGQFRPDNPMFSSLRLAGGWLTVQDAYDLRVDGALVTLSACETGVSAVAGGDELLGLARGFFSAGAPTLVVSLWTVDDASTAELMGEFYRCLVAGAAPAAALRQAQCWLRRRRPHPFYWSPFVLMGRW